MKLKLLTKFIHVSILAILFSTSLAEVTMEALIAEEVVELEKKDDGTCPSKYTVESSQTQNLEACKKKFDKAQGQVLPGAESFTLCQAALEANEKNWKSDFKGIKTFFKTINNKNFYSVLNTLIGGIYDSDNLADFAKYDAKARSILLTCAAIASVADEHFSEKVYDEEIFTEGFKEKQKSFDGRISCKAQGFETLDYMSCINILNIHNGSQVVVRGNEVIQQLRAQDFGHEQQMRLMEASITDGDTSTLGLESQRDSIDKNQQLAEERRTLQVARSAALALAISNTKRNSDLIEACSTNPQINLETINLHLGTNAGAKSEAICKTALNHTFANHSLLSNQSALDTAILIAAEAGIDATKEQMAVNMLGKQKDMIDGIINRVQDAEVIPLPEGFATQDEFIRFCELSPQAVECNGLGTGFTSQVGPGGSLSISGDFGSNSLDGNSDSTIDVGAGDNAMDESLGAYDMPTSTVTGGIDKGAGFTNNTSRAKVGQAGNAAAGGAGGGAPSAAGLSGGGAAGGAGAQAPGSADSKNPKINYVGGGRSLTFGGGRGVNSKSSSKDSGNPFSKLLNKDKGGEVLNFRDLASQGVRGKNSNLFQAISDTYNIVEKKERLLKYDTIKKK